MKLNEQVRSQKRSNWVNDLVDKLTLPSSALNNPQRITEAKVVSALVLSTGILTAMGLLVSLTGYLSYADQLLEWVLISMVIGYGFSRTRYYQLGGLLLLLNGTVYACFNSLRWVYNEHSIMHPLFWLAAAVMLGGFWLRPRAIILLGVFEVGLMQAVIYFSQNLEYVMLKEFLPYFIVANTLVAVSTYIRDRDKQRIANQALQLHYSEVYLSNVIHSINDALVAVDLNGEITTVNRAFTDLMGHEESELVGKRCFSALDPEGNLQLTEMDDPPGIHIPTKNQEKSILTKSGKRVPVLLSSSVLQDADSNALGTVFIIENITERRRLEAQLRESQKNEAMGTLAGGIAHELNNMLGTMLGYVEMILTRDIASDKIKTYLQSVLKEGYSAAELIEQILTFSRAEELEKIPLKISPLIKETLKKLQVHIPDDIKLHQNIAADCPAIVANASQIQQVVKNLFDNAVQSMTETGGTVGVYLEADLINPDHPLREDVPKQRYLKLIVNDTGRGMVSGIKERIFDPFFTTDDFGDGAGMGLSVVYGIVKEHNGEITVISTPKKGATFTVLLPVAEEN